MQFSILATFSSLIALAAAYTTPVGSDPQGNPISAPGLNQQVPKGSPFTITWTPTSAPNTVTLVLMRGPATNVVPLSVIVEKVPNTGSYTWTPASGLEVDITGYGIQLIDDVTGFYQYTTQFGIAADPNAVSSSVPATTSTTSTTSTTPVASSSTVPTTSSTITTDVTSSSTTASTSSTSLTVKPMDTVVYSTVIATVTSCPASVSNCPGRTVAPVSSVPTSSVIATSWANSTMATATGTKNATGVASTGFAVSTTASPSQFTGAGDKIRVGCAMGAVLVAALGML
ncbi:Ser-Thr-rich glycosyl-phosphatidyl-inositol-anchored membrane family-domain-containing protein [Morchella snyderi]|nr:Ser-Thr-rich glycosyl-phosphatidyl-inositol-anchored membrane family-domain-containing protein [Morchella snyderi]